MFLVSLIVLIDFILYQTLLQMAQQYKKQINSSTFSVKRKGVWGDMNDCIELFTGVCG